MNKKLKAVLECMHMMLVSFLFVPTAYLYVNDFDSSCIYPLYMMGTILIFPIIILYATSKISTEAWQYFTACGILVMSIHPMSRFIASRVFPEKIHGVYVYSVFVVTLFLCVEYYRMRMHKVKREFAKEQHDASYEESGIFFYKPEPAMGLWFVLTYVFSKCTACESVCNLALISGVIYLAVYSTYRYFEKTGEYLRRNQKMSNVKNIPKKRIYGIGKIYLFIYVLLLLFSLLPGILTIGQRTYYDMRKWRVQVAPSVVLPEEEWEEPPDIPGDIEFEIDVANQWYGIGYLIMAIRIFCVVASCAMVVILVRMVLAELRLFSKEEEAEDDVVETLEDTSDREERVASLPGRKYLQKEPKIRKKYRRYIRKYRKEKPAPYETPLEIETIAGVAEEPECVLLHKEYELTRYGQV